VGGIEILPQRREACRTLSFADLVGEFYAIAECRERAMRAEFDIAPRSPERTGTA